VAPGRRPAFGSEVGRLCLRVHACLLAAIDDVFCCLAPLQRKGKDLRNVHNVILKTVSTLE
jgi:hypothetical protein